MTNSGGGRGGLMLMRRWVDVNPLVEKIPFYNSSTEPAFAFSKSPMEHELNV